MISGFSASPAKSLHFSVDLCYNKLKFSEEYYFTQMKLFFFDYDGTLHQHKAGTLHHHSTDSISQRTRQALRALQQAGHKIILCTGRCYGHLPQAALDLQFDCYATACGAATFIDGTLAWERRMDSQLLLQSMQLFEDWQLDGAVEGEKRVLFYHLASPEPNIVPEVHSFSEYVAQFRDMPVHKLTLFRVPMPKAVEQFIHDHNLSIINNSNIYYEIIQKGQHKGKAIEDIAAYYHVPISSTYCFGDSMNDAAMLRTAGHSVVVGNAPVEVQALAGEVTSSVQEDGVACWIENFLHLNS